MPRPRSDILSTIRTEGALLPADFLQRLAEGSRDVPGLTPEAYHLAGTERLHEAISRSWNRLLGIWAAFQSAAKDLAATDPGIGVTREKWLLPLFQELGYGRLLAAKLSPSTVVLTRPNDRSQRSSDSALAEDQRLAPRPSACLARRMVGSRLFYQLFSFLESLECLESLSLPNPKSAVRN